MKRPSGTGEFASWLLAAVLFLACAGPVSGGLPVVEYAGSRPAGPEEPCVLPLPQDAPISLSVADSIMLTLDEKPLPRPRTVYDVFRVDLDGDGSIETIAQVVRLFGSRGSYARAWWGIYGEVGLDQVLYWSYQEEQQRLARIPRPESIGDGADSMTVLSSAPTFLPACDIFRCGDVTADGRSEVAILAVMRLAQHKGYNGLLIVSILSPEEDSLRQVFRANLMFLRCARPHVDDMTFSSLFQKSFRLRTRVSSLDAPYELILEPWRPAEPDSLCELLWIHERALPLEAESWLRLDPLPANGPLPSNWMISRWEEDRFGGFRFARDLPR